MSPQSAVVIAAAALVALVFHVSYSPPRNDGKQLTLGLVLGSERRRGNTIGMGVYLSALVPSLVSQRAVLDVVDLASLNLPRTFAHAPDKRRPPSGLAAYFPCADAAWSARVRSWDAVLFVAPEYNGHVPGILKSALDRLHTEWHGMPAGLVALGSEGGERLMESGQALLEELEMEVMGTVGVATAGRRITGAEAWLEDVQRDVEEVVHWLVDEAERRRAIAKRG